MLPTIPYVGMTLPNGLTILALLTTDRYHIATTAFGRIVIPRFVIAR